MDVHKNTDYHAFVAAYASLVPEKYEVDRKNPHRLLNKEPGNYSDVINTYLDWSFQDLVLGHNDGMTGDDIAGEWLLSTTYTRHLWGRAWLMLPVTVRAKYKQVGG